MDSITLTGVSAKGTHGVLDFEHAEPQTFSVDVRMFLDLGLAGRSDDLANTVDYGQIAQRIVTAIEGPHLDLIEALASRIADSILQTSAIRRVVVTVHKPDAPIKASFDDVAVTIERDRISDQSSSEKDVSEGVANGGSRVNSRSSGSAEPSVRTAIIAMGGNLGDPATAMRSAVVSMDGIPGNQIMGISPLYRTTPWGMKDGTPDFLNAVVELSTTLDPMALLKALQMIEAANGRSREVHWGSRPLDLDIIDYDGMVTSDPNLTLPHPRAWQRAFVLAPLADLLPDASLPGEHGGPVKQLLEACPDKDAVKRVSDDWILGNTEAKDEQ